MMVFMPGDRITVRPYTALRSATAVCGPCLWALSHAHFGPLPCKEPHWPQDDLKAHQRSLHWEKVRGTKMISWTVAVPWLLSLATIAWGIISFTAQQRQANRQPFLKLQLDLGFLATETVARLATETDRWRHGYSRHHDPAR
jgi:hypothetical protein